MDKVTVYRFTTYDGASDRNVISSRMITKEAAARIKAAIVEDTAIEIDISPLEEGEEWTPKGFKP